MLESYIIHVLLSILPLGSCRHCPLVTRSPEIIPYSASAFSFCCSDQSARQTSASLVLTVRVVSVLPEFGIFKLTVDRRSRQIYVCADIVFAFCENVF